MRVFRFDPHTSGQELSAYGSSGVFFSGLARSEGEARLSCLRLRPGGALGRHPAPIPQLFVVVEGDGWVSTDADEVRVKAGQTVLWEAGEDHESRAGPQGMTVLVLEGEGVREAAPTT